jgi:hypothetical protein
MQETPYTIEFRNGYEDGKRDAKLGLTGLYRMFRDIYPDDRTAYERGYLNGHITAAAV